MTIMKSCVFFILIAIMVSCNSYEETFVVSDGIFIEDILIISADDREEIKPYRGNILTDKGKIIFAGANKPTVNGKFTTIDGSGKYAIPGLIDSHVHLNNIAGLHRRLRHKYPHLVEEYFQQLPKSYLYFGYTTLIDVDNYAPGMIENLEKIKPGPDIYSCGRKVQVMNDFEMIMDEYPQQQRYALPFLYDHYNKHIIIPDSIPLVQHTAAHLISEIAKKENICVKTLYEDASSGLQKIWELPSKEIMTELVDEAHKEGLPVIVHAPSYQGQKFALETGADIIAHAMWNWTSDPDKYLNTELPASHAVLLKKIANKKIGYQPTFRTILGEVDILDDTLKNDPVLASVYPKNYLQWLHTEEAKWSKTKILGRPKFLEKTNPEFYHVVRSKFESEAEMFDQLYKAMELKIQKAVKLLADHDARLLLGTDNGAMNMYTHPPGYNGYLEMKHWRAAGVSLRQIFKAATYYNASSFGLLETTGTIDKDKNANLLILRSNPMETIEAYNDIAQVIIHGTLIARDSLSAIHNK